MSYHSFANLSFDYLATNPLLLEIIPFSKSQFARFFCPRFLELIPAY
jgi:hypothetical protein